MPDTPAPDALEQAELRNRCRAWMNGHTPRRSGQEALARLAVLPEAACALDVYGEGELIGRLEAEVAALLGKPAAVFFHKGVAAQLAALAVWTGGVREALVALPRRSRTSSSTSSRGSIERLLEKRRCAGCGSRARAMRRSASAHSRRCGRSRPSWSSSFRCARPGFASSNGTSSRGSARGAARTACRCISMARACGRARPTTAAR